MKRNSSLTAGPLLAVLATAVSIPRQERSCLDRNVHHTGLFGAVVLALLPSLRTETLNSAQSNSAVEREEVRA
jgi:hypothetical protein